MMRAMSEKRKKKDGHKHKLTGIRFHPLLIQQLELLARRNTSKVTEEIRIAVRERLERAGLWPPPGETGEDAG